MELECAKCGKKFIAKSAKSEFCTDCVSDEFQRTFPIQNSETEFADEGTTREEFFKQNAETQKRQQLRAQRLKEELAYGAGLSPAGKIRFSIGLGIFLFSVGIALLNNTDKAVNSLLNLEEIALRIFCVIFGVLSTIFIFTSSKRHKAFRYLTSITVLTLSYFMADFLEIKDKPSTEEIFISEETYTASPNDESPEGRILNDADLKNFLQLSYDKRTQSAYAIFIDHPDPVYRTQIRDYIHRNLMGDSTSIYSRNRGYLYIVENAPYAMKDISAFAGKFGTVYYADPTKGIYEVEYNGEIARMSNRNSQEVINTPTHPTYVPANIEELQCKIPERIARAAQSLSANNSPILRVDILENINKVLDEPWQSEPRVYDTLITALITYSAVNNAETTKKCIDYVRWNIQNKKASPPLVINYLIDSSPNTVAPFIIDQWIQNPIVWNSFLEKLGSKAEKLLIEKLAVTTDLQVVSSIVNYFGKFGSEQALPYVTKIEGHPDRLLSQAAQKARLLIEQRLEKK